MVRVLRWCGVSSFINLIAVSGPLEGTRVELKPDKLLLIGRSFRGLHLPDPLVSIEHAEIAWVTDHYWVTDLGSQSGTWLDESRLGMEARPLVPGSILRIGETELQVAVRPRLPTWALPLLGLLVVLGLTGLVLLVWALAPLDYEPVVRSAAPILLPSGEETHELRLTDSFVRETGQDHRNASIERVTDFDGDGISEVWLGLRDARWVFTFAEDGSWSILGKQPKGCVDQEGFLFPDQKCGGLTYHYESGAYRLARQQGVVVWMPRPGAAADGWEPPRPYRVTMGQTEALAGFLADRGVTEPVHYLVCEEFLPGLGAQVLTERGEVRELGLGCIDAVQLEGDGVTAAFGYHSPLAVAFTAEGHAALLDDLRTYYSGAPDGLFLGPDQEANLEAIASEPRWRYGGTRLVFTGSDLFLDPISRGRLEAGQVRIWTLADAESRRGQPASSRSVTRTISGRGPVIIDPPGCSELEVTTLPWTCALRRWCFPTRSFMTVTERGCGVDQSLVEVPYSGGTVQGADEHIEVIGSVDIVASKGQIDVLRARVSYRVPAGAAEGSD